MRGSIRCMSQRRKLVAFVAGETLGVASDALHLRAKLGSSDAPTMHPAGVRTILARTARQLLTAINCAHLLNCQRDRGHTA